jgi:hypothetical protein
MSILEISYIVAGIFSIIGLVKTINWIKVSAFSKKVSDISERAAKGLDGIAGVVEGMGYDRAAMVIKEIADIPDELGDLAAILAEKTKDNDFTTEEVKAVLEEGKELVAEGKELVLVVKKK